MQCHIISYMVVLAVLAVSGVRFAQAHNDLESIKSGVCFAARIFTNGMEFMVNEIGRNAQSESKISNDFRFAVSDLQAALSILATNRRSTKAWLQLEDFFETAIKSNIMAYSVFGVSVIYLVDELCLSSEIHQKAEHFYYLQHRLGEIHTKWQAEQRLIKEFNQRLASDTYFQYKKSDLVLLDSVKQLIGEVKDLLGDIKREMSDVKHQRKKAEDQSTMAGRFGTIGGSIGATTLLYAVTAGTAPILVIGVAAGGYIGNVVGRYYGEVNTEQAAKLLRELDGLKTKAETLYLEMDSVHIKLIRVLPRHVS
ncbi:uncharacterized protein LOC144432947 [Glandiceps talaboti]